MPLYDFVCPDCKVEEERICSHSSREFQECKSCGSKMTPQLSAPKVVSGVHELHAVVPDGFKTVLKSIQNGAPRGKDDKPMETKGL